MTRWAADHGLGATLAVTDGNLLEALRIDEVPSVVFVRDGRIVGVGEGEVPARFLLEHARR